MMEDGGDAEGRNEEKVQGGGGKEKKEEKRGWSRRIRRPKPPRTYASLGRVLCLDLLASRDEKGEEVKNPLHCRTRGRRLQGRADRLQAFERRKEEGEARDRRPENLNPRLDTGREDSGVFEGDI